MPRHPDPDNFKPHKFPYQLMEAIAENSHDGSFFLATRGDDGNFVIIPHFTNQADLLAFYTFINIYSSTMLENTAAQIDDEISGDMFGDLGDGE